jgi:transcriptional regulator with XRE-family HTH domain
MDVGRRVGANIKRLRKAQGLSQEELAHRAEMHRTFVSQIERAVKSPTLESLDRLAKALGVPLAEVVA